MKESSSMISGTVWNSTSTSSHWRSLERFCSPLVKANCGVLTTEGEIFSILTSPPRVAWPKEEERRTAKAARERTSAFIGGLLGENCEAGNGTRVFWRVCWGKER